MKKILLSILILLLTSIVALADCPPPQPTPGNDHPDDSYIISTLPAQPPTVLSDAKLTKLMAGYSDQFTNLLNELNTGFIGTDINSDVSTLLSSSKVLVIPTGGLSGLDKSDIFKAILKEYVSEGGTLVVFAQQHGYEYSALPTPDGNPIQAYGWIEDMSCQYASSYIDTWHQVLSGQINSTPDINVDGYFFDWPSNATVLLRRIMNGQPDLMVYPCGKGYVIAATIYSDYASGINEEIGQERNLVRDILTWASNPQTLSEVHPGNSISFNLLADNDTTYDASKVRVNIYDPDRSNMVFTQDFNVPILANNSTDIPITFSSSATSPLGIYHSTYELFDANANSIKPPTDTDSGRFVISNPPQLNYQSPDFNFSVQSTNKYFLYGSNADFNVMMFNNTTTARTITAKYFFPHDYWATYSPQYGGDWTSYGSTLHLTKTLTIPAKGYTSFTHELDNISASFDRLWAYFYDENGNQVGMASMGFYVVWPNFNTKVTLDQAQYTWNQPIHITTTINNNVGADYPIDLKLNVIDDNGKQVGYFNYSSLTLPANGSLTQATDFVFPAKPKMGTYYIAPEVKVLNDAYGFNYSFDSASCVVRAPEINVTTNLPNVFLADSVNNAQINITNEDSFTPDNGSINLTLKAPDGQVAYSSLQNYTVNPQQQQTLNFPINPGNLKLGYYQLNYDISRTLGDDIGYTKNLLSSYTYDFCLNKASFNVGDQAVINLGITNTGTFQEPLNIAVSVPDAGYTKNDTINAAPGKSFATYSCIIPSTISAGQHSASVVISTSDSGSTIYTGNASFDIPPSKLVLNTTMDEASVGDSVSLPIQNIGGIGTTFSAKVSMKDSTGHSVYENTFNGNLLVSQVENLAINLANVLAEGHYTITCDLQDFGTGDNNLFTRNIFINGSEANVSIATGKENYLTSENVDKSWSGKTGQLHK